MKTRLVYSPHYDFSMLGLEKLHPFDPQKFSKAWQLLYKNFGRELNHRTTFVNAPVTNRELSLVHNEKYLQSLRENKVIANILAIPLMAFIPHYFLNKGIIAPARYATSGTIIATQQALGGAIVFNLGGGFHHAFADHGEGFCFFADAALALQIAINNQLLCATDCVISIDLDAHRGNGLASLLQDHPHAGIFDLYNMQVYPGLKDDPHEKYPFIIPLRAGLNCEGYLSLLKRKLPLFLQQYSGAKLAFYNAGTDILATDKLGGLNVSYEAIVERDKFVIDQLYARKIPTVIMTSGGYSPYSYKLIADLATHVLKLNT
ncbi:MAG TPA: histone deacetylase [Cellvibrio sp.]|nr:histone deacetylase [Cellvibrio sp.]